MCLTYSRLVGAKLELSGFCKVEMPKEVLSEVLGRRRTEISAAAILELSTRQTRRLLTEYRDGGGGALIRKARGRTSNNGLSPGIREYVIELVRSRYADFGPSLAAEVLFEKDGVKVSRETLRRWPALHCTFGQTRGFSRWWSTPASLSMLMRPFASLRSFSARIKFIRMSSEGCIKTGRFLDNPSRLVDLFE